MKRGAHSSRESFGGSVASAASIAPWMLATLAIPRIIRMLYPQIWIEDDFYLESAFLVSRGMRPYLDFVHPHLPLLEWIAAIYLKLFGANHRSFEFLNEAMLYAASVLTYRLGLRITSRSAAAAGALTFACASLVFRYHVYERECFIAPMLVWCALVSIDESISPRRQAIAIGAIAAFSGAIKLTSAVSIAAILGYLAFARRRIGVAVAAGAGAALALGLFSIALYARYGYDFAFQVFLFHFFKGRSNLLERLLYPMAILDWILPVMLVGFACMFTGREKIRARALIVALVAANYAFYSFLSPTAWAHNFIEVLPFISIVAGVGIARMAEIVRESVVGPDNKRPEIMKLAGIAILAVICVVGLPFTERESWLRGSVYGFGFIDRSEVARLADAIRAHSGPDDEIIAPAFAAFEANRVMAVRFPETYGVYRAARKSIDEIGFSRARSEMGNSDFADLIARTATYWTSIMRKSVEDKRASVVVNDSPLQLVALVRFPDSELSAHGYQPVARTEHYVVWARIKP
jgi:hypothetical protein